LKPKDATDDRKRAADHYHPEPKGHSTVFLRASSLRIATAYRAIVFDGEVSTCGRYRETGRQQGDVDDSPGFIRIAA
jgi:hypothetical protein